MKELTRTSDPNLVILSSNVSILIEYMQIPKGNLARYTPTQRLSAS